MKKILCLISLVLVFSVVIIHGIVRYDGPSTSRTVITKETGHIYETGIKITKDGQTIRNYDFVDIAIGIAVWSSNNYIADCTFTGCPDEGIVFFNSNNNIVENCVFSECADGIELQWSSDNTFVNCQFSYNTHAGIDAIRDSNNDNLFISCIFQGNPYGCYFKESENNRFVGCEFMDNKIDMEERK